MPTSRKPKQTTTTPVVEDKDAVRRALQTSMDTRQ
jgi:hypothetical protein